MNALVSDKGFWIAFALGVFGVGVTLLIRHRHRWIGFGPALATAAIVGLLADDRSVRRLVVGLIVLVVGTHLTGRRGTALRVLAVTPGALVVASAAATPVPQWARVVAFVAIVVASPLVMSSDAHNARFTPVLFALSMGGVYWAVPDTENARTLVGAFGATALFSADRDLASSPGSAGAATGLLVWCAATGGWGRRGSVVGAIACLGVLLLLGLRFVVGTRPVRRAASSVIVLAVQVCVVAWASRVAGLRGSAWSALVLSALALGAGAVVLRISLRRVPP